MEDFEAKMQRVSQIVSILSILLMVYGFAGAVLQEKSFSLPGSSVLPLTAFSRFYHLPLSLVSMSAGIVMLSSLPGIRVLLAFGLYVRSRDLLDTIVALVVLFELLFSIHFIV